MSLSREKRSNEGVFVKKRWQGREKRNQRTFNKNK